MCLAFTTSAVHEWATCNRSQLVVVRHIPRVCSTEACCSNTVLREYMSLYVSKSALCLQINVQCSHKTRYCILVLSLLPYILPLPYTHLLFSTHLLFFTHLLSLPFSLYNCTCLKSTVLESLLGDFSFR